MTLTWSSFNNNATDSVDNVQCVVWFSFADAPTLADLFPSPASTVGATPLFFLKTVCSPDGLCILDVCGGKKIPSGPSGQFGGEHISKMWENIAANFFQLVRSPRSQHQQHRLSNLVWLKPFLQLSSPPDYLFLNQDKRHPYKCVVAPYLLNSYLLLNCFPLWVQLVSVGAVSDVETCRVTNGSPSFVPTSV